MVEYVQRDNFQILQIGKSELVPFQSVLVNQRFYKISFETEKQIEKAIIQSRHQPQLANLRVYRKYKKFASFSQIPIFKSVKTTNNAVFLHTDESEIWVYGKCFNGEMGIGEQQLSLKVPMKISLFNNKRFKWFSVFDTNSVGIDENQELYCWGIDLANSEPLHQKSYILKPQKFFDQKLKKEKKENQLKYTIAQTHSMATYFLYKNDMYVMGLQNNGKLGLNDQNIIYVRNCEQIQKPPNMWIIKGISAGESFAMCWDFSGSLFSWGDGKYGRLGHPCYNGSYNYKILKPQKIQSLSGQFVTFATCGTNHGLALTKSKNVYSWGHEYSEIISYKHRPNRIQGLKDVIKIQTKNHHNAILDIHGRIFQWGKQQTVFLEQSDLPTQIEIIGQYKIDDFSLSTGFMVLIIDRFQKYQQINQMQTTVLIKSLINILNTKPEKKTSTNVSLNSSIIYNSNKAVEMINTVYSAYPKQTKQQSKLYSIINNNQSKKKTPLTNSASLSRLDTIHKNANSKPFNLDRQSILQERVKIHNYLKNNKVKKLKKTVKGTKNQINRTTYSEFEIDAPAGRISTKKKKINYSCLQPVVKIIRNQLLIHQIKCFIKSRIQIKRAKSLKILNQYIKSFAIPEKKQTMSREQMSIMMVKQLFRTSLQRRFQNQLIFYQSRLSKITRLMKTYVTITKIIRSQISLILDFNILENCKLNKTTQSLELGKLHATLALDMPTIKRMKFELTKFLVEGGFNSRSTHCKHQLLPILPYSRHMYEMVFRDQNKFTHYKRELRYKIELKVRNKIITSILRANIQYYIKQINDNYIMKEKFIIHNMDKINNERIRLLLSTKYIRKDSNQNENGGDFLPHKDTIKKIAKTLQNYPKKPQLNITLMLSPIERSEQSRNRFKNVMNHYTDLLLDYLKDY